MLDDKYRIEHLLATGGMGAVYVGTHIGLRKRVAIKILNPHLNSAPMIERFHREAVTASQIGHEGIAQVTDLGTSSEGEPFLVMEYLEGESLASRLRMVQTLSVEDACELGCAILSPLAAAHRAGIVHRDLKPDNVFLVRQSRGEMVKLLDFGISRAAGQDSSFRLTTTGLVLGTPYYMSPEQARGESVVTPAADLYAFGVILYEMLIGEVPIRADNYNALMYRVTIGDYVPPRVRRPDLPESLEYLIMRAMARMAADRPASAGELEQALLPFCRPVFRDHATGAISGPRLPLKTPMDLGPRTDRNPRSSPSSPGSPGASFRGPTLSDGSGDVRPITGPRAPLEDRTTTERTPQPAMTPPPIAPPLSPVPPKPRSRVGLAVALCVVGAGLIATLVLTLSSNSEPSRPTSAPAVTPPAVAAPVAEPPAPPAQSAAPPAPSVTPPANPPDVPTITVKLAVDPPGATVTLDDAAVSGGQLTLPRDGALHRLRITAAGYLAYDETLRFDESQRLVIALKRTAPAREKKPPRKGRDAEGIDSQSPYQ